LYKAVAEEFAVTVHVPLELNVKVEPLTEQLPTAENTIEV
jgi:hypothetical protein